MCGIAGIVNLNGNVNVPLIKKMGDKIRHRGPDDEGIWISDCKRIGLAHRRLSIIDLSSTGHQPMLDSTNNYVIVYNGEIYNYLDIKKQLMDKGHIFNSSSDTEVILNSYREWGTNCIEKFNGMFAFALYDTTKNIIFMARDRAGEKPLFYGNYGKRFYFASELKAIMADQNFEKRINKRALDCYLAFGYVPGDLCILENVKKLPPAHALVYDIHNNKIKTWKYWELPDYIKKSSYIPSGEYLEELENLLTDSIKRQFVSDVPVGLLLSGGIDSSLVTALASQSISKLKTFTITFPGYSDFDESNHASLIADHFSTEHTELECPDISVDLISKLAIQYDEPIADSSMFPTYMVTKLIKNYCTVAIGGDGGDELFGGYSHYSRLLWTEKYFKYLPKLTRSLLSQASRKFLPLGFKGRIWLQSLIYNLKTDIPLIASNFDLDSRKILMQNYNENNYVAEGIRSQSIPNCDELLQRATRTDFLNYLPEDILVKVDRASMLNSLEMRAPFLDYRIIEFAFRDVPSNFKTTTSNRKIILKSLAKKLLPEKVDLTRKQGFAIPLKHWLKKGEWLDYFSDTLLDTNHSIFNKKFVESLFKGQKLGYHNSERLFSLVLFEHWRREYSVGM